MNLWGCVAGGYGAILVSPPNYSAVRRFYAAVCLAAPYSRLNTKEVAFMQQLRCVLHGCEPGLTDEGYSIIILHCGSSYEAGSRCGSSQSTGMGMGGGCAGGGWRGARLRMRGAESVRPVNMLVGEPCFGCGAARVCGLTYFRRFPLNSANKSLNHSNPPKV
jgi:hypothetical protein